MPFSFRRALQISMRRLAGEAFALLMMARPCWPGSMMGSYSCWAATGAEWRRRYCCCRGSGFLCRRTGARTAIGLTAGAGGDGLDLAAGREEGCNLSIDGGAEIGRASCRERV